MSLGLTPLTRAIQGLHVKVNNPPSFELEPTAERGGRTPKSAGSPHHHSAQSSPRHRRKASIAEESGESSSSSSPHQSHRRHHHRSSTSAASISPGGGGSASPSHRHRRTHEDISEGNEKGNDSYLLYGYWRSSCTYRVRIALNLKKCPFDVKPINLVKGEQHEERYQTEFNALGLVPTLVHHGVHNGEDTRKVLSQSVAIIEYLNDIHPDVNPLLPKDPYIRSQVRSLVHVIVADTQPATNLWLVSKVEHALKGNCHNIDEETMRQMKQQWLDDCITRGLLAYEKMIDSTSGKYSVGDTVTMADVILVPMVYNARRYKLDLSKMPKIVRIVDELNKLPEFANAAPEKQPDAVAT